MKNKGFTLIELLAVIVILAIIALIAVPIIINIINGTKEKSKEISKDLYLKAVEQAILKKNLKEEFNPSTCTVQKDGNLDCNGTSLTVEVEGEKPCSGTITITKGLVTGENIGYCDGTQVATDSKEKESPSEWFTYEDNDDGTASITGFSDEYNQSTDIIFPSKTPNGKTITEISYHAFSRDCLCEPDCPGSCFKNPENYTKIIIPENIKNIGDNIFECNSCGISIDTLEINSDNIYINSLSQHGSLSIENLIIGDNIKSITELFLGSNYDYGISTIYISTLKIGKNVTKIEGNAFDYANIETIDLGPGVQEIGTRAFPHFGGLKKIINRTGKSFDWKDIIGESGSFTCNFITGTCGSVNITSE